MTAIENARLATIVALVAKKHRIGRAELIKLCYLLQTIRNVPLGYRFTLYSYGPFDAETLSDILSAEQFGRLRSNLVLRSNGYTYETEPSKKGESLESSDSDFTQEFEPDFNWVIKEFGECENGDLELLTTIVYVDRETGGTGEMLSERGLIRKVHDMKPHPEESFIRDAVRKLASMGLLQNLKADAARSSAA